MSGLTPSPLGKLFSYAVAELSLTVVRQHLVSSDDVFGTRVSPFRLVSRFIFHPRRRYA